MAYRLWERTRAAEWWDYKLVPAVAVLYATALIDEAAPGRLLLCLVQLVIALAIGALFVGTLNDLTDRNDDRRSGKPDRIGTGSRMSWVIVSCSAALGCIMLASLASRPIPFLIYALGWIAFCVYSIPPARLKNRAALGVICDTVGAHVVPATLAVALVQPDPRLGSWFLAVAVWSFAYGLRGILGHQLADLLADREAGLKTFVTKHGSVATGRIMKFVAFPAELAALAAILFLIGSPAVWLALAASVTFQLMKVSRYGTEAVVAYSSGKQTIILADFYLTFLPLGLLASLAMQNPIYAALIPVHLLLFPAYVTINFRETIGLLRMSRA